MHRSSVTSFDVAQRAGVSQSTVSIVLGGKASVIGISEKTRRRVLDAATELGYSPDPSARALRRRRGNIIGFIPRTGRDLTLRQPVPFLLHDYCARAAARRGYHVVEIESDPTGNGLVRLLQRHRADGVLFHSPQTAVEVQQVVANGWPAVQLMVPQAETQTAAIYVDPRDGIHAAIDHLVALGHERIAYIGFETSHRIHRVRLDHVIDALARYQITLLGDYQRVTPGGSISESEALTHQLLALPNHPTALFAASDMLALGVMRALYTAQIRVPEAMSVVSFDDLFAPFLYPPLTSVAQPLQEVAERAIALLVDGLESDAASGVLDTAPISLPTQLIVRDSTGPVPAGGAVP